MHVNDMHDNAIFYKRDGIAQSVRLTATGCRSDGQCLGLSFIPSSLHVKTEYKMDFTVSV